MQNRYHYLIAGLPDLSFPERKEWISIPDFKIFLKDELESEDFEQVKLVFLKDDNYNLVKFLETGEIDEDKAGNYSLEDFKEQKEQSSAIVPEEIILPRYMIEVMNLYIADDADFDPVSCSHIVAEKYYEYVQEKGSSFMKDYTHFDYNLDNLLSFVEAGKYEMDQEKFITGKNELTTHLKNYISRPLVKDPEFDLFTDVIAISELPSIAEKEMKYDQLRWQLIDDMIFFEEFTIDWVLGYLHKMFIVRRWAELKHEEGEEKLRNIIRGAKEHAWAAVEPEE